MELLLRTWLKIWNHINMRALKFRCLKVMLSWCQSAHKCLWLYILLGFCNVISWWGSHLKDARKRFPNTPAMGEESVVMVTNTLATDLLQFSSLLHLLFFSTLQLLYLPLCLASMRPSLLSLALSITAVARLLLLNSFWNRYFFSLFFCRCPVRFTSYIFHVEFGELASSTTVLTHTPILFVLRVFWMLLPLSRYKKVKYLKNMYMNFQSTADRGYALCRFSADTSFLWSLKRSTSLKLLYKTTWHPCFLWAKQLCCFNVGQSKQRHVFAPCSRINPGTKHPIKLHPFLV